MSEVDKIRNTIIDRLLSIKDKNRLGMILNQIETLDKKEIYVFTEEQKQLIELSILESESKKTISNEDLFKSDTEWLKNM